jgi:preprotein translocase subunit Sec61beta
MKIKINFNITINGDFMAKKDKKVLPPSGAGLVRYFEEETKGPTLTPEQVVIITIILAAVFIALRFTQPV